MLSRANNFMINSSERSFILEIEAKRCKIVKTNISFFPEILGKENEILVLLILHLFVIYFQNEASFITICSV